MRGKYGYVDPDGNKREFTYVSGNPCDPNAPKEEEQEESNEAESEPNVPANYPTRPIHPIRRPIATSAPKPAVTLFQSTYAQEDEQPEPEQLLRHTPAVSTTILLLLMYLVSSIISDSVIKLNFAYYNLINSKTENDLLKYCSDLCTHIDAIFLCKRNYFWSFMNLFKMDAS